MWYEKNRDRILAESHEFRRAHPELQKYRQAARLANQRYPGRLTVTDARRIFEASGGICYWCKRDGLKGWQLTLEHLKPVNDPAYIVAACYSCNCARLQNRPGSRLKTPAEAALDERWYQARWRFEHADKIRAQKHEKYLANPEPIKARSRARHQKVTGTEEYRQKRREWWVNPKFHQKNLERRRKWVANNHERYLEIKRESYRRRKEAKLNA